MKKWAWMAMTAAAFAAPCANADFIGFEPPTYTTTGGPGGTAQITGQDGWGDVTSGGAGNAGVITTDQAYAGVQSFQTSEVADDGGQSKYGRSGFTGINGQTGASVDFYMKMASNNLYHSNLRYFFGDGVGQNNSGAAVGLYNTTASPGHDYIQYYDGETPIESTATIAANVWYHYTLTFDFSTPGAPTYDLNVQSIGLSSGDTGYVDLSVTDLAFRNTALTDITGVLIVSGDSHASQTNYYYTDNLSFNSVPEPGMLSLMGLGGLMVILRRRR